MADAPGTCHLVGCEGKGTVDEHVGAPIGCPDTFAPYEYPISAPPVGTTVPTSLLVRADSLLRALLCGRLVNTSLIASAQLEEARILADAFRSATGAGRS